MSSPKDSRRARQQLPAPDHRARSRRRHATRARRFAGTPGDAAHHAGRAARSGAHPHPLSARAERLPAHRPRQEHLPQLRPGAGLRRHLPPALRRHQPREGRAGVRRRDHRRGALARLRLARARAGARRRIDRATSTSRATISTSCTAPPRRWSRPATPTSTSRASTRCARAAATSRPPGTNSPFRDRTPAENLARLRADEERRARRRRRDAAREDRHGEPEHQPARPGALPHQARDAPQHRRPLVHLPDVHLRASDRGRAREHHALDLHARVRGPAAVLRLAARHALRARPARAAAAAPVRVRAPQRHLRDHQQAKAAGSWSTRRSSTAGTTRACRRSPACAGAATRRNRSA